MKILNFSVKDILPALLDGTKTQTIRKAWKDYGVSSTGSRIMTYTEPKYEVGEKVQIMWKQRSPYKYFCKLCGGPIIADTGNSLNHCDCSSFNPLDINSNRFSKKLRIITIADVFKAVIGVKSVKAERTIDPMTFSKRDGFQNFEQLLKTLDDMYNTAVPKSFWVYRW